MSWRFYDPGSSPVRDMLEQLVAEQRRRGGRGQAMPINVYDDGGQVVVEAAIPGVDPEAVEVSCSDSVLTIRGVAEVREREYLHQEIGTAEYLRQVALPGECRFDEAEAAVEHGILTVRIPKVRPQPPEKIRIQVNRKKPGASAIDGDYSEVKPRRRSRPPA